ncbi:UbiD family decarboxylase [Stratiformator vulcanicus]|uniref:4-hydroxybenzoate decarboxylase subunit C n=1 Tax=Stratiformator vulcanicus TaxID=2527980 RepID=A0A517R5H4_9PLAN|nr:UbiD family decarboxylase [Stratiformator vulcanicus]QDT39083.1 4-hydroxybenzoate decarboxylase subunit C [Stratiformator vulcanicus]
MGYRNLTQCVEDLERSGQLVRIAEEIDPHLEMAEIHRRVYQAGGPALLFERPKGGRFPMVSNLFGTFDRAKFLFRDALRAVEHLVELKIDPANLAKNPWRYRDIFRPAMSMLPRKVSRGPILAKECKLSELPQLVCWPDDGGPFVTLPEVYSEDPAAPGLMKSNLGMYRVQLAGNDYDPEGQVGLHYQLHRSIGVHHAKAIEHGEPFHVNIFVGGSPAMMLAAVMPLPEGMSELTFAGALSKRAIRMVKQKDRPAIYAEADFCICGTVDPNRQMPEGPFGDHLGYYAKVHDFPVLIVDKVYHRDGAIWPFTVVGRPPQEDTSFGKLIHELTGPAIPTVIPGVHGVNAVDESGVHPLLLAIGSERYVPYASKRQPQELLTIANAILGQGQLSLAKYLLIAAKEDAPDLNVENVPQMFDHILRRVDWTRDLHFQTRTTIDTLDYSGTGFNEGSKLVIAAAGEPRRELPTELPSMSLPDGFDQPQLLAPGIVVVQGPKYASEEQGRDTAVRRFCEKLPLDHALNRFPLVVIADDSEFTAQSWHNFLWVTFTRSNPATDIEGVGSFIEDKHWGCRGSLVIDARIKPHHAPPLIEDPEVTRRVDKLAAPGGPLHGLF